MKCKCALLQKKLDALAKDVEALESRNRSLAETNKEVTDALQDAKRAGWDERHLIKLKAYEYFHSRVLNARTHCQEDKAYLNRLLEDVLDVLRNSGL